MLNPILTLKEVLWNVKPAGENVVPLWPAVTGISSPASIETTLACMREHAMECFHIVEMVPIYVSVNKDSVDITLR